MTDQEIRFFWVGRFDFFFKKKKMLHPNENKQSVHMRYHLFLHYGWFLQNLGKDFIRTNMHTTVGSKELGIYELESCPIFIGIFFAQFNQIWNITNVIVLWFVLLLSPWTLITTLIMQSYIVFDMQWFLGGIWKQSFPSRKPFWLQP